LAELTFEIVDHLLVLSQGAKGWTKELNIVSWNNRKPKIDLREWDETHQKMGKGITLRLEELKKIKDLLEHLNLEQLEVE
jgi:hypothetical protein